MSAFGGEADIRIGWPMSANDPKQTLLRLISGLDFGGDKRGIFHLANETPVRVSH